LLGTKNITMKEYIEIARRAIEEQWDAYKIMAEFMALQKELDAKIAETHGSEEIANAIRQQ
jgi:hypothetical protein